MEFHWKACRVSWLPSLSVPQQGKPPCFQTCTHPDADGKNHCLKELAESAKSSHQSCCARTYCTWRFAEIFGQHRRKHHQTTRVRASVFSDFFETDQMRPITAWHGFDSRGRTLCEGGSFRSCKLRISKLPQFSTVSDFVCLSFTRLLV